MKFCFSHSCLCLKILTVPKLNFLMLTFFHFRVQYRDYALPLAVVKLPEECSSFTPDFIIQAVNSFIPKMPIILWGYQSDPFLNLSNPAFSFKLMSDFKSLI